MAAGVITPDADEVWFEGMPVRLTGPADAQRRGVETAYRDPPLAPGSDAAANLHPGPEILREGCPGRLGVLDPARPGVGAPAAGTGGAIVLFSFMGPRNG